MLFRSAKNGDLLGFGGKNSNIDGRMPLARSTDGGKAWHKSKTIFDPLASGQRPSVIRLASGRLFFVGDHNPPQGKHKPTDGAYVALSDDDGTTWTIKNLPPDVATVGYTTATQGPDGTIHVVTSKNTPNVEIELNEAWVLDKTAGGQDTSHPICGPDDKPGPNTAKISKSIKDSTGRPTQSWSSILICGGQVMLDGPEKFLYPNGKLMYSADFSAGYKVGEERYLRQDGTPFWVKKYAYFGTWTWDNFDASGHQITESHWRGKTLLSSDVPDPPQSTKPAKPALPVPDPPAPE